MHSHELQIFFVSFTSQPSGGGSSCRTHASPSPAAFNHATLPGRPPTSTMLLPSRVARGLAVPIPALMFTSGLHVRPESVDVRLA